MTMKKLSPKLDKILQLLNSRPRAWVTTLDFYRKGIMSPAGGICELRKLGAIIEVKSTDVMLANGTVYKRVRHYCFKGWLDE